MKSIFLPRGSSPRPVLVRLLAMVVVLGSLFAGMGDVQAQTGNLTVDIIAGYNLVVDSNVTSPSTYAPRVATVIGKFCNTGDEPLTNVYGYIGDYDGGTDPTPGIYPVRDSDTGTSDFGDAGIWNYLRNSGDYYYRHVGSTVDATRYMGTIDPGECRYQYWTLEYPACENNASGNWEDPPCTSGDPLWGTDIKPDDDFSLPFYIWGDSDQGGANADHTMTMRNEISAMANKIRPNPDGDWFNTENDTVNVGDVVTTNGINYTLGNVRFGFDNDGDYVPDYNAWLQPISQPDFDPTCFRLIDVSGELIVSGPDLIIPIDNNLYFTNLPADNTNVVGKVYYKFLALNGPCSMGLTPYQESASGFDNEKFNGDYGTAIPVITSLAPKVTINKASAPDTIAAGDTTTYTISFNNTSTTTVGLTLSSAGVNMPLVISDTIPTGMEYITNSAKYDISDGITATIRYNTSTGWTTTEPSPASDVTALQWWLSAPLPAGGSGSVSFQARVPSDYTGDAIIENTACIGLGDADPFACDDDMLKVTGENTIAGTVFEDDGAGPDFANKLYNSSVEDPIGGITVTLYISTTRGWVEWGTTMSDATTGDYSFTALPDGEYRIDVGSVQSKNPGWTNTTDASLYVDLDSAHEEPSTSSDDNDFGFAPALTLDKTLIGPSPALEDQLVSYTIELNNILPGDGTSAGQNCEYIFWSQPNAYVSGGQSWQVVENSTVPELNGSHSYSQFNRAAQNHYLQTSSFDALAQTGTITQVEALYNFYTNASIATDVVAATFLQGATSLGTQLYYAATIDNYINNQDTLSWDITSLHPSGSTGWAWSDFTGTSYTLRWVINKDGNGSSTYVYIDSIGYRITTDQMCGGDQPNTTIDPLPMTDTYDADKMEFYSAEPVQTSVNLGGPPPYANTGSIYWNNLGPLYAGGTKVITVTFRVKDGIAPTTITNTATVDNAYFSNGNPTNEATDYVTNTVQQTARLGDLVWNDVNGDGSPAGELGIPGVVIALTANVTITIDGVDYAPGTEITTTTDADGYYLFTGLRDGTYTIEVDTSTLPGTTYTQTFDRDGTTDDTTSVTLSGTDVLDADFGYQIPNTLMGTVWHDHDGLDTVYTDRDPGDEGFGSVTVNLEWYNGSTWVVTATVQTEPDGSYLFSDLANGDYRVVVDTSTLPHASSVTWEQTVDPDGMPDDTSGTYSLSGGQLVTYVDFAYHEEGDYTLGGTVYADWNDNARLDPGEMGFNGVTVSLYSSSGALIATTTTNASGVYTFTDLITDTYTVVVDRSGIPTQYGQTEDYDERPDACTTCDSQAATVEVNATYSDVTDVDFGYAPRGTGAIGDTVYRDMDGDGVQDVNETGIDGVTVWLYVDYGDGNGYQPVLETTTANGGQYLFENLPPGDYRVVVDDEDPKLPTDRFGHPYVPSTPESGYFDVTLEAGETYLDADFGFMPLSAIGDTVWQDTNGNGNQDEDEPGISGVTVNLYAWNDDGDGIYEAGEAGDLIASDTTDDDGNYLFDALPAGSYAVLVDGTTLPSGLTLTGDPDVLAPCSGTGGWCDGASGVHLDVGQIDMSRDFGYQPPGVIGDYVWFDNDGDGVQDGDEQGIGYVTVELYKWNTETQTWDLDDSTETDSDGHYTFGNVGAGTYEIRVVGSTLPDDVTATYDRDDETTSPDGIVTNIVVDNSGNVTSVGGQACSDCNLKMDFGYRYFGDFSISGTVFYDAGGPDDGLDDLYGTGDTGIEGITVYLWKDGVLVGTAITGEDGGYTFGSLAAGNYVVSVNPNAPQLADLDLTASANPGYAYKPVTIGPNADKVDFGFWDPTPTAVHLTGFWATAQDQAILLTWETATELDNLGFNLYRAESPTGMWMRINAELIPGQAPGSPMGAVYAHLDAGTRAGVGYYYWLEAVDIYGHTALYGPVSASLAPGGPVHQVFLPLMVK